MQNQNQNGFTLIEVLIAVAVLTIGVLAMQAMQGMSVGDNAKSGAITAKSMLAAGQIEQIMALDYDNNLLDDDDGDGTNQDLNLDGRDDDDDGNVTITNPDEEFGLRHWQCCLDGGGNQVDAHGNPVPGCVNVADGCASIPNEEYEIYWNVAVDYPIDNTKTINIIVIDSNDRADTNREMLNRAEYRYIKDDVI